jgi:disulfide bond formation protein DsbB
MLLSFITPRRAFALAALGCAALLAFGYFLQYVRGLEPCPLCLLQRGFFYLVIAVSVLAALHNPGRKGRIAYASFAGLFAIGGGAVATRQVWLQHLPPDKVPQCGPDLFFMMENFPLSRTLKTLLTATGECAKVDWTFLGFSIAEWSLVCFSVLLVLMIWIALRRA